MNGNAIHGAPKKGLEWRIALSNHYAWLQTRRWRTHERKRNSWGSEKGDENGELHKAITTHSSKLEGGGHMNKNKIHGASKKG